MLKNREDEKNNQKRERKKQIFYLLLAFLLCLIFSVLLIIEIIVNKFTQNGRLKLIITTLSCVLTTLILGAGIVFSFGKE